MNLGKSKTLYNNTVMRQAIFSKERLAVTLHFFATGKKISSATSAIVIVINIYSPSCLGQKTAKGPFGLRVKLPPVYHIRWRLHTVPLIDERQAGKLRIPIFTVFGLSRPGIEPESTVSVADALSTRPQIG